MAFPTVASYKRFASHRRLMALRLTPEGFYGRRARRVADKVDTRDGSVVGIVPRSGKLIEGGEEQFRNVSFYGMAIDKRDNVWYGVWQGGPYVGRIDGDTHELRLFRHSGNGVTRGVAVDLDGNIWAAGWSDRALYKFNPDGELLLTVPVGDSMMGVAVDAEGGIFGISTSRAYRYNTNGVELCRSERLPALYTYSDMTGIQLLTITLSTGRWSIRLMVDRMMSSGTSLIGTAHCPMAPLWMLA